MNENKGIRLWQWAVLLLVLCHVGLIVTIWLKPHHDGPPNGRGGPRDYVISQLHFSEEQVKKYDVLIQQHQQAMQQLRAEAKEYRERLFAGFKNGSNPDSLAQLIGNNQKQIEIVTYRHFAQVRDICTDAQKTEFDNIIGDVTKKMNGHGGNHPPPGEGGPPPHHRGDGPPPGDGPGPPPPGDR